MAGAKTLKSKTQYLNSGQSPLSAKKAIITPGTINVVVTNAVPHRANCAHDRPILSRPTRNKVTTVATNNKKTNSVDFIDTPKQSPRRRPAMSARGTVRAPLTKTVMHRSQSGTQRLSVRNSKEVK